MGDYISYIKEQIQYKKHIFITGSKGSGKSTLLRKIISAISTGCEIPGIITWCEPGTAVYMQQAGTDNNVTIGIFDSESTSNENRMKPVRKGFDEYGTMLIEQFIKDSSEWVSIDEIGYLESISDKYIKMLKQLFDKKRVLAVVRKQETELIKEILSQKNALVIDLDCHIDWRLA